MNDPIVEDLDRIDPFLKVKVRGEAKGSDVIGQGLYVVGVSGKIDGSETVPGILCIDCTLDLVDLLPWDSIDNPD